MITVRNEPPDNQREDQPNKMPGEDEAERMLRHREATKTAIKTLEQFVEGIDELVAKEHRNIFLQSSKGALMFCLRIIREEVEIYD